MENSKRTPEIPTTNQQPLSVWEGRETKKQIGRAPKNYLPKKLPINSSQGSLHPNLPVFLKMGKNQVRSTIEVHMNRSDDRI